MRHRRRLVEQTLDTTQCDSEGNYVARVTIETDDQNLYNAIVATAADAVAALGTDLQNADGETLTVCEPGTVTLAEQTILPAPSPPPLAPPPGSPVPGSPPSPPATPPPSAPDACVVQGMRKVYAQSGQKIKIGGSYSTQYKMATHVDRGVGRVLPDATAAAANAATVAALAAGAPPPPLPPSPPAAASVAVPPPPPWPPWTPFGAVQASDPFPSPFRRRECKLIGFDEATQKCKFYDTTYFEDDVAEAQY